MQEVGGREGDSDERPVVILLARVHLFSVHLLELCLCELVRHLLEDVFLVTPLGDDQADVEVGGDSEAKHSVNESTNNFQVHQSSEEILEAVGCRLGELLLSGMQSLLKN